MSKELNIDEHNILKNPNLGGFGSDFDPLKEELNKYEQDNNIEEIHECTVLSNGKNNKDNIEVRSTNFPTIINVEHNSVSFDIEILEEVEEIIGDNEKPDLVDLENEINVIRTTVTDDKFETFFKQQIVNKNLLNVNVIVANLDQYLLSSSRFCSFCLTLFSTKNAFKVHMYLQHPSVTFLTKNKPQKQIKNYKIKRKPKTINEKQGTSFNKYSRLLNPPLQSHPIRKQESANSHINLKNVLKNTRAPLMQLKPIHLQPSMQNKLCSTNFGPNMEENIKRMPAFKKCVVVLKKLQIPFKSVKIAHKRLNTNSNTLARKRTKVRTCPKKTKCKDDDDNYYRYKCHICSFYFTKAKSLSDHLQYSHGISEKYPDVGEVSFFYPKCKFCVHCFKNPLSYNNHLWKSHRETVRTRKFSDLTQPPKVLSDRKTTVEISSDCFEAKTSFGTTDNNTLIPEKVDPSSQVFISFLSDFKENSMNIVQDESKDAIRKVDQHNFAKIHHDETHSEPNIIRSLVQTTACKLNQEDQRNTKTYMLQSAYFKCLKCDIYFLSSNIATNHKDHMEMLIHWKCSICKLVFKKEDEMHELQHAFTDNFTVYGVLPGDKIRILYSCPKCGVHFDSDNFFKHYPSCENNTPQAKYCTDCDILIDDLACKEHQQIHKDNKYTAGDFLIVESDVIPVLTENETMSKHPGPNISSTLLKLYFCKFCKSYFHNMASSQAHIQGRCKKKERKWL